MSEEENWFRRFSQFMDQNIRGVQYGIYSVAGIGLMIALRSVRPFAKFSLPSDIPAHFVEKRMPFTAKVKMVEPGSSTEKNPLLLVDHHPLIVLFSKNKTGELPLEVSSVNITNNGFVWLQSLLTNQEITFVPLRTTQEKVYSIVINKKQNVGLQLVKIGFATVSPIDVNLQQDDYYLKYYKSLIAAEKKAEKKGTGLWAGTKVPMSKLLLDKVKTFIPFSL